MKVPLALAVGIRLNEYFPLSPLFLKAAKGHLLRLEGLPPVAHALPAVVPAAKCNASRETAKRRDKESIK